MKLGRLLATITAAVSLAFTGISAYPAMAETGFHGAYFSESAFLALTAGQTGQFSVGYTNTGDQAWVKGVVGQSVSLHTAAPLDNTNDSVAGWGPTWVAPNVYARQLNDLVAPGQIGFFVYDVKVPLGAAIGPHTFYGRPVVDGVTALEDYGYYQIATVVASGFTLVITGSSPASPSTSTVPTISGTGAPPNSTVTITEGSATLGSATSSSTGAFAVTISGIAVGSHSLVANAAGATSSAVFTYVVSATTTTPSTPTTTAGSLSLTQPGPYSMIVTFPRTITAGSAAAANFRFDSANFPTTPTLQTGSLKVRLDFPSTARPSTGSHSLDVFNIVYEDSTLYTPNPSSFTVTISADTTLPTQSFATAVSSITVDVTFSEPMRSIAYYGATNAIDSPARYTLTNSDGSPATTTGTNGSGSLITVTAAATGGTSTDATIFNESKARLTLSAALNPSTTYIVVAQSVADQAGNILTSGSSSFVYTASGTLPILSSISATQLTLTVTYSKPMQHTATAGAASTVCAGTGTAIDRKSNYTLGGAMSTALADAATRCTVSSDEQTVTFTFPNSTGYAQGSYTYSIANVSDNISATNLISPNPTAGSVTASNSAPKLAGAASVLSGTSFSVTYSEPMSVSDATLCTGASACPSARYAGNYSVAGTGATSSGAYGDLCNGATTITASNSNKTFTISCATSGKWNSSSTTAVQVRDVLDADASTRIDPNPQATSF